MNNIKTKICSKCKVEKDIIYFSKHKKEKDGLRSYCKDCAKVYKDKYDKAHKEYSKEYSKMYRNTHRKQIAEYRKNYIESYKQYLKDNKEKIKDTKRKYRASHKEEISKYFKNYHRNIERNYCLSGKEQEIENYNSAKAECFNGWQRHHRLETHTSDGEKRIIQLSREELIALDMYYNRPPEELIWLKCSDHTKIHKAKVEGV